MRSALPLPCATQVPEQARMTGSTAVTRPLAGRLTTKPPSMSSWMYGSRFDTTMIWSPLSCVRSSVRSRSAVHSVSGPCERRYSSSKSRSRARKSAANGASSGAGNNGLTSPSPRISARAPLTHPRQLNCATTTVMKAITRPSAVMRPIR